MSKTQVPHLEISQCRFISNKIFPFFKIWYFQMFLSRKKTEICKNKYKRFKNENCERAKRRSAISYDTLEMIYQQLFDMSRKSHTLSLQSKVKNYKNFLSSASEFLRQAKSCEYNPQWNPRIVKVSTGQLRHNCHTYII